MELSNVRMAVPADANGMMGLCHLLHSENALFPVDDDLLRITLGRALCHHDGILGVIGPEGGELEGAIYLLISRFWYSRHHHLEELFSYVHPEHRKSPHAKSLINFAKQCSDTLSLPLNIGVLSDERMEAKVRLYQRQLGKPRGAFFFWNEKFAGGPAALTS